MVSFYTDAFATHALESNQTFQHRLVAWPRSNNNIVCLNVDGSMLGSLQITCFGGLICNNLRTFLKGFYDVAFEIMVVRHGLESCWVNGYMNIVCYSYLLQAVLLIRNGVLHYHNFVNEIYSIQQFIVT
jgi:hypothetical protein